MCPLPYGAQKQPVLDRVNSEITRGVAGGGTGWDMIMMRMVSILGQMLTGFWYGRLLHKQDEGQLVTQYTYMYILYAHDDVYIHV